VSCVCQVLFTTDGNYKSAGTAIENVMSDWEAQGTSPGNMKPRVKCIKFIPCEEDAEARRLWGYAKKGARAHGEPEIASLNSESKGFGWEKAMVIQPGNAEPLPNRGYGALALAGVASSKCGTLVIPLPSEADLVPKVTMSQKLEVVKSTDAVAKKIVQDGEKKPCNADVKGDALVPLFHYDRHTKLIKVLPLFQSNYICVVDAFAHSVMICAHLHWVMCVPRAHFVMCANYHVRILSCVWSSAHWQCRGRAGLHIVWGRRSSGIARASCLVWYLLPIVVCANAFLRCS